MRVLITGGYGFIGAWIIRTLLARGDDVFVFDLKEDPRRLRLILPEADVAKVTFLQGDVTDLPALTAALLTQRVTHVIHLAGLQVPTCRVDPMLGAKVNVLGTLAVFEAILPVVVAPHDAASEHDSVYLHGFIMFEGAGQHVGAVAVTKEVDLGGGVGILG